MSIVALGGGSKGLRPALFGRQERTGTYWFTTPYAYMTASVEQMLAPAAIDRAMGVYEDLRVRDDAEVVQARKALTECIFGLIASGQTDADRLVVAGLTRLKSLEAKRKAPGQ